MEKLINELNRKGFKKLAHKVKAATLYNRLKKYDLEDMDQSDVDELISDHLIALKNPINNLLGSLDNLSDSLNLLKADKVKFTKDIQTYVDKSKGQITTLSKQLTSLLKKI